MKIKICLLCLLCHLVDIHILIKVLFRYTSVVSTDVWNNDEMN